MRKHRISDNIKLFDVQGAEIRWLNRPEIEALRWLDAEHGTPVTIRYAAVRGAQGWTLRGMTAGYEEYAPVRAEEIHNILPHAAYGKMKFSSITALRMSLKLNAGEPLDPT